MGSPLRQATDGTFTEATEAGGRDDVVVLDFWSETCMPCRQVSRILSELEVALPSTVRVLGVDAEENPLLVDRFDVGTVPTVLVLRGGEVVERFLGVERPQVLKKAIERHADPDGTEVP